MTPITPRGHPLLDATHDPALRSWVASANDPLTEFPIQNLPYGRFRRSGLEEPWRIGVAIGDQVLDLHLALAHGRWPAAVAQALQPLADGDLNAFMVQGAAVWRAVRQALSAALADGSAQAAALQGSLLPHSAVTLGLPCRIGDYTDFYSSIHHATTVGRQFRPDNPLLPNYQWVPIGYHGRSSSIVVSGQDLHRPWGQMRPADAAQPLFGPSRRLDYELELGLFIGPGNPLGQPLRMDQAEAQLFGVVLFNDWSARDIQGWEYQPLGPFLAKNFGSTVSPWIVTMDALAPFRRPFTRPQADPQPLPYLDSDFNRRHGAIGIELEVWLQTAAMREAGHAGDRLSQSNGADAYWSWAQLVAHHTVGGCNLQPGDLLGTGTLSGPEPGQGGSLLELSAGGQRPLTLSNGEQRSFLADGDTVVLRGRCSAPGARSIGFGECRGRILPAVQGLWPA